MNETLLIIIGVAVFSMTFLGTLIYFYSLILKLEAADLPDSSADAPRSGATDV